MTSQSYRPAGKAEVRERALSFICPNPRPSVDDLVKLLEDEALLARKEERKACANELLKTLGRCLNDAKEINGYVSAQMNDPGMRLLKVLGHTTGMIIRLERELTAIHQRNEDAEG